MSDTKPWTEAMMAALDDGEWRDKEDILTIGAATVSSDRALEEMGERSLTMTPERRQNAGARTVALQALQGRRRFGAVEFSKDGRVRKTGHDGVSIGHVAERVDRLESNFDELRALVAQLASRLGVDSLGSEMLVEQDHEIKLELGGTSENLWPRSSDEMNAFDNSVSDMPGSLLTTVINNVNGSE